MANSSSGTPPPASPGTLGHLQVRGASASAPTVTWSTGAVGPSMLRTWDLYAEGHVPTADDPDRRRRGVRARRPLPGRTEGRLPAGSTANPQDGSGSSTPSPAKRRRQPRVADVRGSLGQRRLAAPGSEVRRVLVLLCIRLWRRGRAAVLVLDSATGRVSRETEAAPGAGVSPRSGYVDGTRSPLVGDDRGLGSASWTPRPFTSGRALRQSSLTTSSRSGTGALRRSRCSSGDGTFGALAGDRRQRRQCPLLGGRGHGVRNALGRLSGRLDGRDGGQRRRDRHHRRRDRSKPSGAPPASVPRCSGSTTPTTESSWSQGRQTAGSACGTPPRSTCSAPCTHPTAETRSRPAHSSSATATT